MDGRSDHNISVSFASFVHLSTWQRVPYTTLQNAFTLKYLPISSVTSTCKNSFTFTENQGNHDSRKKVHVKQTVHESHLIQTCIHGSRLNKKLRLRSRKKI